MAATATAAVPTSPSGLRGYERVMPASPDPYTTVIDKITDDGDVFWRTNASPPPVEPDGGSALSGWDSLVSKRGASGWSAVWLSSTLVDVEVGVSIGLTVQQVSADGTKALVYTYDAMSPLDTDGLGDSYVVFADGTPPLLVAPDSTTNDLDRRHNSASNDFSVVTFLTSQQLAPTDTDTRYDLYARDSGGAIHHVSVDADEFDPGTGHVPFQSQPAWSHEVGMVSNDGQRIFFSTPDSLDPSDTGLYDIYMRVGFSDTVRLTAAGGGSSTRIVGTTDDGDYVFVRTTGALVAEDVDTSYDIYRIDTETLEADRLTAGDGNRGALDAHSADGEHATFRTDGVLDAADIDGGQSLYRWDEGAVRYLGPIDANDVQGPGTGEWRPPSRMSEDGRVVAWSTHAALTPDDTDSSEDVYVDVDGVTSRISQSKTGGNAEIDATIAGLEWLPGGAVSEATVGRGLTADGSTVYLTTAEALVPGDINAMSDVYGWSSTGDMELISPGTDRHPAVYAGNSPDGTDVFFRTAESFDGLSGSVPGYWDARIGGGFPIESSPPPCSGDDCAGAPVQPEPVGPLGSVVPLTDDAGLRPRARFAVRGLSRSARRRLARTGRTAVRVRVSARGRVRLIARAHVAGRHVVVGRSARTAARAGTVVLRLKLSKAARRELRRRGRLRLAVDVRFSKAADDRRLTLRLRKSRSRS